MKCFSCSVELQPYAENCHKCGAQAIQEIECECGEFLDIDEKICPECGKLQEA